MTAREALGECLVHADHQGPHVRITLGILQNGRQPFELSGIELVRRRIVEVDEIHALVPPVIVGPHFVVMRVIFQALLANHRRVQPIGKGDDELVAAFWRDGFVIADSHEKRQVRERFDLVPLEVRPGRAQILRDGGVRMKHPKILIEIVDGAQISQMPIKYRVMSARRRGNRGHDHIATVAGVRRHGELPRRRGERRGGDR